MPHARGDEPLESGAQNVTTNVCPTHVGMNRFEMRFFPPYPLRMPHARGDEPAFFTSPIDSIRRMPHARGDEPPMTI